MQTCNRYGFEKDQKALIDAFGPNSKLQYEIKNAHSDDFRCSAENVRTFFQREAEDAERRTKKYPVILICIMGHGQEYNQEAFVIASDMQPFSITHDVKANFSSKLLRDTPKLIVIHACRATEDKKEQSNEDIVLDQSARIRHAGPPLHDDIEGKIKNDYEQRLLDEVIDLNFFTSSATTRGFRAYETADRGSFLIQNFCEVVSEKSSWHLNDIDQLVRQRTMDDIKKNYGNQQQAQTQVAEGGSTLMKKWRFSIY